MLCFNCFFFSPSMSTLVQSMVDFWLCGDRSWPSDDLSEISKRQRSATCPTSGTM